MARLLVGVGLCAASTSLPRFSPADEGGPTVAASPAAPASAALRSPSDVAPVASYALEASLDPEQHVVRGEGTIRFQNRSARALGELRVHLYLNAFESERTVFGRRPASGFRGVEGPLDHPGRIDVSRFYVEEMQADVWPADAHTPGDADDRTDIPVPLPRPIEPGESITIRTQFTSRLPAIVLRTGHAGTFHLVGQWFPKLAKVEPDGQVVSFPFERFSEFYADFGDYDVVVDVPDGYVVGATGSLVEELRSGKRVRRRYRRRGAHDFAFAAWDRFVEKERGAGGVRLRVLHPPGYDAVAERELEAAVWGLAFFGERFGEYPFDELTIVHPPEDASEAGGMEYPGLITTGGAAYLAHVPVHAIDLLVLHELGHQWFQGMLASNESASPFLDEGLTTWATGLALEARHPGASLASFPRLEVAAFDRVVARPFGGNAPIASPAARFATGADYAALVYGRTATVLRTIDGAFEGAVSRAIAAYARQRRFTHPTPDDLVEAVRREGGEPAALALSRALFERGSVDFEAGPFSSRAVDGGFESTALVRRLGSIELPVEIDLVDERGGVQRRRWDGRGEVIRLTSFTDAPLAAVIVDPERRILLDDDKLDDARGTEAQGAPRVRLSGMGASLLVTGLLAP